MKIIQWALTLVLFLGKTALFAQTPANCVDAVPMCNGINSPNVTSGSGYGQVGCLYSSPRPAWYYLRAETSGTISIQINQNSNSGSGLDVDYALWGPFADPTAACSGLPNQNPVRCSYSSAAVENFTVQMNAGDYYILLVTNFNGGSGTVSLNQTNAGASGAGALDCSITVPTCEYPQPNIYTSTSGGSAYLNMREGCLTGQIDFWLSFTYSTARTITYTVQGTATNGTDYDALSGTISLPAGESHGVITINPIADGIAEGTETITIVLSAPGSLTSCPDTIIGSVTMNIVDEKPPHSAFATPAAVCPGGIVQLADTGAIGATYSWRPVSLIGNTYIDNPTVVIDTVTTFYVDVNDPECGILTDSVTVYTHPIPSVDFGVAKNSCCEAVILNQTPDSLFSYLWSTGDTVPTITVSSDSTSSEVYAVTVTNQYGCTAVAYDTVNTWCIRAFGTAVPDSIIIHTTSELTVYSEYTQNLTYVWLPDSSVSPVNAASVTSSAPKSTTYQVLVIDTAYGCIDSTTITLVVIEPGLLAMPSAFTPNGDGVNDLYYPVYFTSQATVLDFRIYNRWGELIYNNPNQGWDGNYKGEPQPVDIYTYYVYMKTPDPENPLSIQWKEIKKQGSFTLLR